MACIGVKIGSSGGRKASIPGGTLEEIHWQFRRSTMAFGEDGRRRWQGSSVCFVSLGGLGNYATSVDSTLRWAGSDLRSGKGQKKPAISPQLDQLMKQSVAEIVKNISEAPFLVHVYSEDVHENGNGDGDRHSLNSPLRMVIEKATSESWPFITQRWEGGNSAPDGVILVEELGDGDDLLDTKKEEIVSSTPPCCTSNHNRWLSPSTKVWGLLVQGRGVSCPACYILKTCQVQCCFGFSTHFCLAKVDCFGKSIDFHLNRMWLQR